MSVSSGKVDLFVFIGEECTISNAKNSSNFAKNLVRDFLEGFAEILTLQK